MRYLFLFLAVPMFAVRAGTSECDQLKNITEALEKKIQSTRLPLETCSTLKPSDLALPDGQIGFTTGGDWDYRCKDLSTIDLQLKTIENEIALLKGIAILKDEIAQGKTAVTTAKNPNIAVEASQSFYRNLKIASAFELFMAANNDKSENILSLAAKADESVLKDKEAFGRFITANCGDYQAEKNSLCDKKDFELSDEVFAEIRGMIVLGAKSRRFDKKQVKDLRAALAIKNGTEDFSYTQLLGGIKDPGDGSITQAELEKLKATVIIDDKKYDFLSKLGQSKKNLTSAEGLIKAQETNSRFVGYLSDLKNRQDWEMKSKISLVLKQFEGKIPDATRASCEKARENNDEINKCFAPLLEDGSKELTGAQKNSLKNILAELDSGRDYLSKFEKLNAECVPDQDHKLPAKCEGIVTHQLADLIQKAQVLSALKVKLLQATPDLLTFRDYALEQLLSSKCMASNDTNISDCSADIGSISKEALVLTGQTSDIMYVLDKPKTATSVKALCLKSQESIPFKSALCNWKLSEDPKTKVEASKPDTKLMDKVMRTPVTTNTNQLSNSIAQLVGSFFGPRPQQQLVNPYQGNVYPYSVPTTPLMDPSQKILYPGLVQGLGQYSATFGATPYRATRVSNVGTTSAYDFGSSKYMNSAVGW